LFELSGLPNRMGAVQQQRGFRDLRDNLAVGVIKGRLVVGPSGDYTDGQLDPDLIATFPITLSCGCIPMFRRPRPVLGDLIYCGSHQEYKEVTKR